MNRVCLLLGVALLASSRLPAADFVAGYDGIVASKGKTNDAERLQQLFQLDWDYRMHQSPEAATHDGYRGLDHLWSDESLGAIQQRKQELQPRLKAILSIDRAKLKPADQLSHDLFARDLKLAIEATQFPDELFAVSPLHGVQQSPASLLELMTRARAGDYENILARLRGLGSLVDQNIEVLREGLHRGIVPPRITLRDVPQQARNQVVEDPMKSPLLRPFAKFPKEISEADQKRLRDAAAAAYREVARPAYERLGKFLADEYVPGCRESIGLSALPNGKAWYALRARLFTTTTMTPEEIHALGQREVKRIRAEMELVKGRAGFPGSLAEFFNHLRSDPKFFYQTGEDLLAGYRDIAKRADPELAKLFGKLPRMPYGVVRIPGYAEKSQTTAYYQTGSVKAGRPGNFFANTYDLPSRPKWEMEALTLHEAVPGHHLQLSLADELENVPDFRRQGHFTAYVEGWGLYAESLGEEMGFYQDPYMKFGQLTYEMWRAIRLVVDTGMHALGWSRQRAIDFFMANAGKVEHDIVVEVDRYIVWPGQALAYKIGELKLKELRARATKELGERFDVRAFHDEVLGAGALPLDILEKRITAWIAGQKRAQ